MKPVLAALALLAIGAAPDAPVPATPPAPPANGEMGFIMTEFAPAIYQGKDDCPQGLAGTLRENYLESLAAPERARLSLPANEERLKTLWQAWTHGPNNTNVCANAESFPDRATQKTIQGKVARGLDLDGGAPACAHEDFTSPSGVTGLDNQAYRAMGCTRNYRGVDGTAGDTVKGFNMFLATGEHSMVLLLRGVDSLSDDPDVEVILATTDDRPILDSHQNFLTGVSYSVGHNPAWRNVMHGRIDKGVLTTQPVDMRLRRIYGHGGLRGEKAEWDLRSGRLRLEFQPDGSVKGILGAYQTPRNVMISTIAGGLGAATVAGMDCASQYNTMMKLADGGLDPKTGKCTTVSMALEVAAIPAFVFDRTPAKVAGR